MMRQIYFYKDSERGVDKTYRWLREEVDELGEAIGKADQKAIENELADVIAWLASLANVVGTDLETATLRKYDNCCPRCHTSPCKCAFRVGKD